MDNIYSHRSTQKYKKKPFISHYWDCRLKGRPPGTPKSEDPNKKKRKRNARERDLCDVKIKITEYFPENRAMEDLGGAGTEPTACTNFFAPGQPGALIQNQQQQSQNFGVIGPSSDGIQADPPGSDGSKYYTVQRVNGNGGNGKDGTAGPHKHTLQESDRVKKSSIARHFLKIEKVKKKTQVGSFLFFFLSVFCVFAFKSILSGSSHAGEGVPCCVTSSSSLCTPQIIFLFHHNPLSKQTYIEPTPFPIQHIALHL